MSVYDTLIFGILAVHLALKMIDDKLLRHYAFEVMSSMPFNQWVTYDEVVQRSNCPELYAGRILIGYVFRGTLEIKLLDDIHIDPAVAERVLNAAETKQFGYAEMFAYKLKMRVRRRKKKWWERLLPKPDPLPLPV